VSCAKMAEPIEMQLGILSQVGPGNMYYMWNSDYREKPILLPYASYDVFLRK